REDKPHQLFNINYWNSEYHQIIEIIKQNLVRETCRVLFLDLTHPASLSKGEGGVRFRNLKIQ
ncbi:MAG TPA: hypothetical protein VKC90_14125, partial [Chitinophagaceae bacterium]|nr:hypothetical protein [Chitinophagaceae bacterium]